MSIKCYNNLLPDLARDIVDKEHNYIYIKMSYFFLDFNQERSIDLIYNDIS